MNPRPEVVYRAPRDLIINLYVFVALVYCFAFSVIFFTIANLPLLGWTHTIAFVQIVAVFLYMKFKGDLNVFINGILSAGTLVVVSLFATTGWEMTGFIWPFAYLPYVFFLARGKQVKFWTSVLFGLCLFFVFLDLVGVYDSKYSTVQLFNYFVALFVFCFCLLLFQDAQQKNEALAIERQADLQISNESLAGEVTRNEQVLAKLAARSDEVETLNDFLVDRELKMIEVQKENEQLKKDLKKSGLSKSSASTNKKA